MRAVFRLAGEVRELGADPTAWSRRMLDGLGHLAGAYGGYGALLEWRIPVARSTAVRVYSDSLETPQRAICEDYMSGGHFLTDPSWPGVSSRMTKTHTAARDEFADDRAWRGSSFVNEVLRPLDSNEFLISSFALPGTPYVHGIRLQRGWGEKTFNPTQRRLVQLFHAELGYQWARDAERRPGHPLAALPPRQRQILTLLLAGDAEKQVAAKLDLSRHTVHNHITALYRRLGVASRAELMARAAPARLPASPRLPIDPAPPAPGSGDPSIGG